MTDKASPFDIRAFRQEAKLTQHELAVFLGVTQKTVSRWECGVDHPNADVQARLQILLANCGESHWPSVYQAIRDAAMPVALIDDRGRILVASKGYSAPDVAITAMPVITPAASSSLAPVWTILVVEDQRAVLKATRAVLERWQFHSIGAATGESAADMVGDGSLRPDAAIIDMLLPGGMDGVDTAAALRQILPDLPILLITGEATPPRLRKISISGLPLIEKPVNPHQLKTALLSLLPGAIAQHG